MPRKAQTRHRKSSIDTLDPAVREAIDQALKGGRLTLDQILGQIRNAYPQADLPSRSALGRYSLRFEQLGAKMRESREIAKVWADRLGSEPQGDVGKLVMELLRTMAFDATLELQDARDEDGKAVLDPGAINTLALAMQRLEAASKVNLDRERELRAAALAEAADKAARIAKRGGMSADAVTEIRRQILGIPDASAA